MIPTRSAEEPRPASTPISAAISAGTGPPGTPPKNLLGLPWRVAFALQEDGWILRNAIVWHKPNAMPESVRDRLNCRHELIFLLVKQSAYWFDLDPIRIPHMTVQPGRGVARRATSPAPGSRRLPRRAAGTRAVHPSTARMPARSSPHAATATARNRRAHPNGRNPGDVWSIPTRPYAGPHFAAFPIELPLRCIAAGCKPGGTVLDMFTGSGTTGLAALQLGRRFTGIELSPAFADLAAERLDQGAQPAQDGGPS